MNALLAAALLSCMQGEARCVLSDQGPIKRLYICGIVYDGRGEPVNFSFRGIDGRYSVSIAPECRDA